MNNVELIGKNGYGPEIREIAANRVVARMSVEVREEYVSMDGMVTAGSQWHIVVAWGELAKKVALTVRRGHWLHVKGRIVHRSYTKADGSPVYLTEVVASEVAILDPKTKQPIPTSA